MAFDRNTVRMDLMIHCVRWGPWPAREWEVCGL